MLKDLLADKCNVLRYRQTLDEYNTPVNELYVVYGQIDCRFSRETKSKVEQNDPQPETKYTDMIYLEPNIDIKAGDIVENSSLIRYRAGEPYKAMGRKDIHHIEVLLSNDEEI